MESSKTNDRKRFSLFCGRRINSSSFNSEKIESTIEKADSHLQSLADNKTFSGSVLLARNDQILLIKGYGCSEYICRERNTSQTIYRVGSVTKPFTATIILKLYERKQIDLNNKLSFYYPDYPNGNRITIKHLLSNTSGIEDYTDMEIFEEKCQESLTIDQVIDMFKNEPLKFKPGSKYSYSNSNFILLGFIIEKVTGKSYESNLREIILEPCLMNDSGYECDCYDKKDDDQSNKRAYGYICSTDSNGFETCRFINMSTARSAGGIFSTIEDLYRFDRSLYGEKVLLNRSKKIMFTPVKQNYALGWEVYRLKHRRIRQQHTGQIFGFSSCFARFPNDNACIIVLSNLEETAMDNLLEDLTDILFDEND